MLFLTLGICLFITICFIIIFSIFYIINTKGFSFIKFVQKMVFRIIALNVVISLLILSIWLICKGILNLIS